MQIWEYMCQTALVTFVTDICYLFSRLVAEIGSWGVQMRSMVLTWPKRNRSSRLLPLATANRKTLVQKRRNRSSAAVSQHACAPLTALCVAYNKISMLSLFACVQPVFHYAVVVCMCAARVSLRPLVKQQPGHLTYIYIYLPD